MNRYMKLIGVKARKASDNKIDTKTKNKVLRDYTSLITKEKKLILKENKKDIGFAKKMRLEENLINRLLINEKKLEDIITSVQKIEKLRDPVDVILDKWKRPNGLKISRVTIPIGVIAVIYESRPNVTSDIASLCFKSGNSVILKGGSEAYYSNRILSNLFRKSLKKK